MNENRSEATYPFLTLSQACRVFQLAPSTLRAAIDRGQVPAFKVEGQRRRLRIPRDAIVRWIESQPVRPGPGDE